MNKVKSVSTILVIGVLVATIVFNAWAHNKSLMLWEEYQASMPGCTDPKLSHYNNDCVRSSMIDRELWSKVASGRTPEQIKAERDEVNLAAGVCLIGDWYQHDGVVHNRVLYYPCSTNMALAILQEP